MFSRDYVMYEQPANEAVRVCLRLENLFCKVAHWLNGSNNWDSVAALQTVLEILSVLDRSDFKSKLLKEISHYYSLFKNYKTSSKVDQQKLTEISMKLDENVTKLNELTGRIGQQLYNNKFIHLAYQGLVNSGIGGIDATTFHAWLHQPLHVRKQQIQSWLEEFSVIQHAVSLILYLIRQSNLPEQKIAYKGIYQGNGPSGKSICQLIRVVINLDTGIYPNVSIGRHTFAISFSQFDLQGGQLIKEDVPFELTYCYCLV
jgi:cell division protein ZapD